MQLRIKPKADNMPAAIRAILCPARLESLAPSRPPMQKKLMASVKLKASSEVFQPNSVVKGDFKMDHAYRTPANSIATTPTPK